MPKANKPLKKKPPKKPPKGPPHGGGVRKTDAEKEERIRIVENLIVAGRASTTDEVIIALAERGRPGLADSTVRGYMREARKRLTQEHESLRAARREIVIRALLNDASIVSRLLKEKDVAPRWSDRIAILKLLGENLGEPAPVVGPPMPDDDVDDIGNKSEEELNKMLAELMENAGDAMHASFRSLIPAGDDELPS